MMTSHSNDKLPETQDDRPSTRGLKGLGKARSFLSVVVCLLPNPMKRFIWRRWFGWEIDESAAVGISFFFDVEHVSLGPGSRVGHFNVFRSLRRVELGEQSIIGQWNWITGGRSTADSRRYELPARLILCRHSSVTARHYIDCAGGLIVGAFTVVAGVRSTILTHQIDTQFSRRSVRPICIGDYCFVGSDVRMTPGASIPDRCVVAMGSVVSGVLPDPDTLYGGVPARPIKRVTGGAYFSREVGSLLEP